MGFLELRAKGGGHYCVNIKLHFSPHVRELNLFCLREGIKYLTLHLCIAWEREGEGTLSLTLWNIFFLLSLSKQRLTTILARCNIGH